MMFINMWLTQEHVDAQTQATTHGQLVSSEVEKAMRNAAGFKVIDAGSTLLVETSFSGAEKCQAFHFDPAGGVEGQGTLHMVLASAPAPAPSAGYAWQDGIAPHTDVVFSKLFTRVNASGSPVAADGDRRGRGALQLRREGVRPQHQNRPGRVHRHGFCSQLDSREHHDMLALALKQRSRGQDGRAPGDDAGVALVVVLILMFLGAIAASAVAMMVMTTIQSTSSNKVATQEYVAAESGRDAAVATVAQGIKAGDGTLACSSGVAVAPGTASTYSYGATVRWATDTETPEKWPTIASGADSYSACPTASSNYVVIHATGTVPGGGHTSEVDSAYAWSLQPDTRPAGTLAYFDGQFTATKSTYEGDLVIRGTDNYKCNNGAGNALKGDLWVTNASVEVTGDCYITGSIYAYGFVDAQNKNLNVGGDIITQTGDIDLKSDGVVVGGQIHAGHNVILDKSGTVGNGTTIKAVCGVNPSPVASCTIGAIPSTWTAQGRVGSDG